MSSRAARRRKGQRMAKAPSGLTPRATYTADQVLVLLTNTSGREGTALARDPSWDVVPFGPGRPLVPAPISPPAKPGQQPEPRLGEYPVSYNLQISQVRAHVPWQTLQDAANMPLFRKCIERRKSVAELDYAVVVDPVAVAREAETAGQAKTDIEAALRKKYAADIARCTDFLAMPDRKNDLDWTAWGKLLMENMLKYDATVVYPRRTYGGQLYSLEVPDGHLFKPLIDESGGRPLPPFPAVQQILYGFPRGEYYADADPGDTDPATGRPVIRGGFSANELLYKRRVIRGYGSPYGMPPVEIALLDGLVWMRRMGWILGEYTESSVPSTWLETDNQVNWDVKQWGEWTTALNDTLGGNTAARMKIKPTPPGSKVVQSAGIPEQYKPEYDMFLVKLVAGDFGMTATELGFPEVGSLGASFHEGEQDVLNRVTRIPDSRWLAQIATELMRRQMGMPPVLKVQILGLESEDESEADQVAQNRVQTGRMTMNEDRARLGLPAYGFPEADKPMIASDRGVVFIEGASKLAPAGVLIGPASQQLQAPGQDPGPGGSAGPAGAGQQQPGGGNAASPPGPGKQGGQQGAAKALAELGDVAYRAAAMARQTSNETAGMLEVQAQAPTHVGGPAADVAAYGRWLRNGARRGQFACKALARADAPPEMAADGRVVFKDADAGPKAGLAGSAMRS